MNKDMIELYSDYLIASFGQTTATGLANLLQGSIYHDSITRFLNSETLTAKEQWQLIKPMLRQHENATPVVFKKLCHFTKLLTIEGMTPCKTLTLTKP